MEINKIYNEDCIETMKRMQDNYIDMTISSPPYEKLRDYNKNFEWNFSKFKLIVGELYRVSKDGGIVVWVVGDQTTNGSESGVSFMQALWFKKIGFNLHDTMIYEKDGLAFPDTNRYYQKFEYMFVLSKGKPKTINLLCDRKNKYIGDTVRGHYRNNDGKLKIKSGVINKNISKEYGVRFNIWKYGTGWMKSYKEEYLKNHPAIFPEQLVKDHLMSWTKENDLVYDCFMGSGTTAKCCIELNRNFIGSEISAEYCEIANRRINDEYRIKQNLQRRLFENY
jgi:DNA modification methylase